MKIASLVERIACHWDADIIPQLIDYIRVPAKSPHFDPDWQRNGHLDAVVAAAESWVRRQSVRGIHVETIRLPGRTPLLWFEIPASGPASSGPAILFYGHLDKQPEMVGWREGLGPWEPVIEQGKLYGRGGADDGYAVYAGLAAIAALQAEGLPHRRCVGLIETCEESGSYDLPDYLALLAPRIGEVDLVIGLDSGCGDYERLWATTSLRGMAAGTLQVEVLTEGVHSGDASGIVPSSFRIARHLLSRLEDAATGKVLPVAFHAAIPEERVAQAGVAAEILGDIVVRKYPFAGATRPMADDHAQALLNRTWRPALSVTGADGLPAIAQAGNVLRPKTALKLSLRLPPTVDGDDATRELKRMLEADPPAGAGVVFDADQAASGWNAPATAPWLAEAMNQASLAFFGKPMAAMGEGGTIPFMAMLGKHFPAAQFLITGVLGPKANAHGPNEFLHLAYAKKLTACVADIASAHTKH